MFVRKLVERASFKKLGGSPDGLKANEVDPVLVFHYGIPSSCTRFAYDSIQRILAVSTKDGRIKLFGPDNSQAILQSDEAGSSKYLKFIKNQGILLNVTLKNKIEAWDVDKKKVHDIYDFEGDISAFEVLEPSLYIYVGDSTGNILVLKFDQERGHLTRMKYTIPFAASHGNQNRFSSDSFVVQILPQPTAGSNRVLIIFKDGLIILWDILESKPIFTTGGNTLQVINRESKQVTCACWVCPLGSKIAVGYTTGDILLWSIPGRIELTLDHKHNAGPLCNLNLGYKLEKVPILMMKWVYGEGRMGRLYILGASDVSSSNLVQVVLLNDQTESRTIKLGLQLPEPCVDMKITRSSEQNKHNQDLFIAIGKSGQMFAYDDSSIEKYLLQSQSKSSPSLPREVTVKLPYADSVISISRLIINDTGAGNLNDEVKDIPSLFTFDKKPKDVAGLSFSGFSKVKYLYITGHTNGCLNFWDGAAPFSPILSLAQQDQGNPSTSGTAVTALFFDKKSRLLVSGDKGGTVCFFKFKSEPYIPGSTRKGNNQLIDGIKVLKLNGAILSINLSKSTGHIAVGSDQGQVSLIDIEGPAVLCTESIGRGMSSGVISIQFASCSLHGFEKNIVVVATRDSSVLGMDSDIMKTLTTGTVHPRMPSKALLMEVLVDGCTISSGTTVANNSDQANGTLTENTSPRQGLLVLCSEKAVYVYSLHHVVQGIKKVVYKKKFQQVPCCWASTFYAPAPGLILLFTSGKVEIRCLPELALLKEAHIRGFTYSEGSICSSQDGQIIMVNGDREISLFSVLQQQKLHRRFLSAGKVYRENLNFHGRAKPMPFAHKEKKKGLFSSVFGETKAKKEEQAFYAETDPFEQLSLIFSTENFPYEALNGANQTSDNDNRHDLGDDEDDIALDDFEEKPRGQNLFAGLNKKNLSSKFQTFKGKLKNVKVKNDKKCAEEEPQNEKLGAVDQIKKKYGFAVPNESASAAKMAETKLQDNLRKLQGISLKTTQMQNTARSFSAMAREVLRSAEQEKRGL
ncbi:hypothetical protein SAY87_021640 [Trapa incisa]|uniref:Lethal giant larvae (Lgl)-like C-terminal domain-containing protein n=1 Tax=Trapa incisa TaxID=236973 RepID=A0AAN7JTI8_9MYRT|nr:hypothetical protein SAY87_021640 [Trapa incisa]